jgi:excisionase family DNA binding protein
MKEIIDLRKKEFLSTSQLAKLLKISRVSVLKRIWLGNIKAIKVGRNFIIRQKDVAHLFKIRNN